MLQLDICNYGDAYIPVKWTITVGTNRNRAVRYIE